MKRGWRNDPEWVRFYAERNQERCKREIKRMEFEHTADIVSINKEYAAKIIRAQLLEEYPETYKYGR